MTESPTTSPATGSGAAAPDSDAPPYRYTAALAGRIEGSWQDTWAKLGTFNVPNPVGSLAPTDGTPVPEDKLFVQDMFPYPSGEGLHVGHPLGYIATDVYARYFRMTGRNVLHALGFDAFGLPAEQYAVQTGTHPRTRTEANVVNFRRQLGRLGLGHDSRRSFSTTDVEFYKWTQWIFLQIYNAWFDPAANKARPIAELVAEFDSGARSPDDGRNWSELSAGERADVIDSHRLVYRADSMVNWCPGLGTVLANEEVTADGRSDRGNFPVFRKRLRQWMMRITAYSDRLLDDLDLLDWPEPVKTMQRNWIGRSTGAKALFAATGADGAALDIEVFTTRPDTLFGATYMVLAPEHELVDELVAPAWPDGTDPRWTYGAATPGESVAAYRRAIASKSDLERQESKAKTGVFLGSYATNPTNGKPVPIFIADYVLAGYGTGAIMAVPGHDQRDWDFAHEFGLPIVEVIAGGDISEGAYAGDGVLVNSGYLDGLDVAAAKEAITARLEAEGRGCARVEYKLRDWLFARQRYWGEPFPIVYDSDGRPHALDEAALPVELPDVPDYSPVLFDPDDADSEPSPPLAKATDWVHVELDLGDGLKPYSRDTNVMPQWAGSSWYELRYTDPHSSERFCAKENEAYWMGPRPAEHGPQDPGGVDLYVGGAEHAVLHLLYARFWHKVLYDLGHVSSREPYRRLVNQGYIQAFAYTDSRGSYVPAEEVVERDGRFFYRGPDGEIEVFQEFGKIGKSLKNSISPDEICDDYGADTLRVYEMSMGPLEASRPWATKDVVGAHRFLQRVWRLVVDEQTGETRVVDGAGRDLPTGTLRLLHRTIAGVSEDYAALRNNTAVAKLIEYTNHLTKEHRDAVPRAAVEPLVLMLAPLAPHMAEELWLRLGHTTSLAHGPFPVADPAYLVEDTVEYPVQVNGKVRGRVTVAADADRDTLEAAALADEKVLAFLAGAQPRKVIVVPGRLVNLVV
ncbi:leucine--tRNA ligase [Mycobacterium avium]|uniref:leucine--tRNA ligase n=1 Tax=Mycobacterium avium TaxID=1764 RepID=UPI0002EF0F6A|nr:leucine--tRNA ligase [Mycobacterium avium]AZP79600.1 leucine--tRNA ligase [Mycobacterium avium subsp. paratuberculosis]QPM69677.1 leucine--tRNA ligase [Mycobacterium avium subsp. paratuberculosis S397]QQK48558.1 leucine--tRNA ligase [Mycobacterium avium subsp. paratuberculosis]WAI54658.1 leucine--tRNA ligase [Mycobacterium avium subsp. paratuberculosis]WPS76639.1 leucine--tRNA ligase [Mycobacterium avium subsp. paratuberculosis]